MKENKSLDWALPWGAPFLFVAVMELVSGVWGGGVCVCVGVWDGGVLGGVCVGVWGVGVGVWYIGVV